MEVDESAEVVVALLGEERSPEMLVELGGALAVDGLTAVVDVEQMHGDTIVEAEREDDARLLSLRRRVAAAGDAIAGDVSFRVMLTRDPPGTLDRLSARLHCRWLVMKWKTRDRLLLPYNPLGWMLDHDEVTAHAEEGAKFDLLVLSHEPTLWYRLLRPSRHERIATAATCSVLMVQTPRRRR